MAKFLAVGSGTLSREYLSSVLEFYASEGGPDGDSPLGEGSQIIPTFLPDVGLSFIPELKCCVAVLCRKPIRFFK